MEPRLFGIDNSNRDFTKKEAWGQNQFNSSFPISLCCYFEYKQISAKYIKMNHGIPLIDEISISEAFGMNLLDSSIMYAFETPLSKYQRYIYGRLPRNDVVIQNLNDGTQISSFEIKLTAIPDHTTCELDSLLYGSEIVVRPDTIVYLACQLADNQYLNLKDFFSEYQLRLDNVNWVEALAVLEITDIVKDFFEFLKVNSPYKQSPFLIQPIWKTEGKSPRLADSCLDIFIWSEFAFCDFIYLISNIESQNPQFISRPLRTAIWLMKMLFDFSQHGKFNHAEIIDALSYNTKNDKAFASNGIVTNRYMRCTELMTPRIKKEQLKEIILGGGQNLLSPERRFDAIIYNSPEIFE